MQLNPATAELFLESCENELMINFKVQNIKMIPPLLKTLIYFERVAITLMAVSISN